MSQKELRRLPTSQENDTPYAEPLKSLRVKALNALQAIIDRATVEAEANREKKGWLSWIKKVLWKMLAAITTAATWVLEKILALYDRIFKDTHILTRLKASFRTFFGNYEYTMAVGKKQEQLAIAAA